jgi:lipoprotein-releasing system permease protein
MISYFEITIARRHITARRRQTALSITAVALAVSISVIFSSLANGQQHILTGLVEEKLPHITISPEPGEDYIHLYKSLQDRIFALEGIRSYAPSLSTTATLSFKDKNKNAILKGTDPKTIDRIYKIKENMVQGDFDSISQSRNTVIGQTLAKDLGVKLGSKIEASFPRRKDIQLTVTGIFNTGTPLDETLAFVSLDTTRSFVNREDAINAIEIQVADVYQAEDIAREISSWGYNAKSWQENNPEIVRAIRVGGFWTRFSVLLFMVIAFFGIASIMNLLVVEKTREIGMLMAMGATRAGIRNLFLIESSLLGFIGALIGSALGLVGVLYLGQFPFEIAAGGREITTLPLLINPLDFLWLSFLAVALSAVAAIYPARNASRLDPVIALKGG